jgi:uncharacterized protein YraI
VKRLVFCLILVMGLVLSACAPAPTPTPAPTPDLGAVETQAVESAYADLTASAPTATPAAPAGTPDPALPVAVVPTATAGQPAGVALYNAAIMSGPGTNYVFYGALLGGVTVQVVGVSQDSQWWVISVPPAPNGQGWVSAAYLSTSDTGSVPVITTPPVPPTTDLVAPGPSDPQATALANVYVRTGPGAEYPAYGIAPAGTSGRVIGVSQDGAWWVMRLDPTKVGIGYGWVLAEYTQASNTSGLPVIENPGTAAPVTPAPPASGVPTVTAVDYVNIRTGPGTNYPVLGVAAPGASGEASGKSSDGFWYQIKVSTQTDPSGFAWVSADWVTAQGTDGLAVVQAPPPPAVPATPPPAATAPPSSSGAACQYVSQDPQDGTTFSIGTPFTTTWVLKSTGSVPWDQSHFDFAFVGAYNNVWLHTGPDLYDLSATVQPGQTYYFSVPMLAPTYTGTYGEAWELRDSGNGDVLCQFYVYINVP